MLQVKIEPTAEELAEAQKLIDEGYEQTSSHYRMVARLPPGKTGVQALSEASPTHAKKIAEEFERSYASTYRRMHAFKQGHGLELSLGVFAAFKKLGGKTSW